MASLTIALAPASGSVFAATAAKGAGGSKQEKGLLDWLLGSLERDQLLETDPVLKKVEEKNGGTTSGGRKNSVAVPQKKKNGSFGGFGGLFAKKE
ncbi:hypothetical protein SAY87_015900 [Trapa incisa]|uniref:Thylakoid soluble phosphoprotein TSP9 n=1 Tax=Trapa incisa TaxID=236973 RepID=A0AAN7QU06_9MYRT|nr:hypothetical protein SAY87_015900 [Trapa incisa]